VLTAVVALGVTGELNEGAEKKLCLKERRLSDTTIETKISKEKMIPFVLIEILHYLKR
jgi:hypothetical protein